ncbi:hypothetical protein VTI28DRAFT_4603 [Corynascus sepedonium]
MPIPEVVGFKFIASKPHGEVEAAALCICGPAFLPLKCSRQSHTAERGSDPILGKHVPVHHFRYQPSRLLKNHTARQLFPLPFLFPSIRHIDNRPTAATSCTVSHQQISFSIVPSRLSRVSDSSEDASSQLLGRF